MNIAIWRILDLGARSWEPYRGSRDLQRRTIRNALETVRLARTTPGGHVSIGEGGVTVHYTRPGCWACTHQGYGLASCETALAAMVAGVPWIDTRPVRSVGALLAAPMVAVGRPADPEPWGSLDYAPLEAVFRMLRDAGATIGNVDLD